MNASVRRPFPWVTVAIVAACVGVTILVGMGRNEGLLLRLLIAEPDSPPFAQVASGELWRLVTPMLVHFGILHIVFNMMWMWDLGRLTELTRGHGFLALFVLVTGIACNIAQYAITGNPLFGGMSGVVYALLGYIWMQGRHNPAFGYEMHKSTVVMMFAWYVICWTGLLGPIANWAHTAGLVLGVAWGYIGARRMRPR